MSSIKDTEGNKWFNIEGEAFSINSQRRLLDDQVREIVNCISIQQQNLVAFTYSILYSHFWALGFVFNSLI